MTFKVTVGQNAGFIEFFEKKGSLPKATVRLKNVTDCRRATFKKSLGILLVHEDNGQYEMHFSDTALLDTWMSKIEGYVRVFCRQRERERERERER